MAEAQTCSATMARFRRIMTKRGLSMLGLARRYTLKGLVLVTVAVLAHALAGVAPALAQQSKPNIIMLISDDTG